MNYDVLVCPTCRVSLRLSLQGDTLNCPGCDSTWPIIDQTPVFVDMEQARFWDSWQVEMNTPLHLSPDRKTFRQDAERNVKAYLEAPLRTNNQLVEFVHGWETVLDLGCEDGTYTVPVAEVVKETYGVDISPLALRRMKRRSLRNVHTVAAPGNALPFPDGFFDGVLNAFVIEHLRDPVSILWEIERVLKDGGKLVLMTDSKYYYQYFRIPFEWVKWRTYRPNDPTHIGLMTPKELRNLVSSVGFHIEQERIVYWLWGKRLSKIVPKSLADLFLSCTILLVCRRP